MNSVPILIDYKNIVGKNSLPNLVEKIKPIPETDLSLGLVLLVDKKHYDELSNLPPGKDKINYMDTPSFIDSISGVAYIIYNKDNKSAEIATVRGSETIKHILDICWKGLPMDIDLWASMSMPAEKDKLRQFLNLGFGNPHISNKTPSGHVFEHNKLCLSRKNHLENENMDNDILFIMDSMSKYQFCTIKLKFDPLTIKYFSKLPEMGNTLNISDFSVSQKELSGQLQVESVSKSMVVTLGINKDNFYPGKEEEVMLVTTLYSFHTHPREAYQRHGTKFGWPSSQDYNGFLVLARDFNANMHAVVTLEGVYILCLHPDIITSTHSIDDEMLDFVLENYCQPKNDDMEAYIEKINGIKYKGSQIILLQFLDTSSLNLIFSIYIPKRKGNCFIRDTTLVKFLQYYA